MKHYGCKVEGCKVRVVYARDGDARRWLRIGHYYTGCKKIVLKGEYAPPP